MYACINICVCVLDFNADYYYILEAFCVCMLVCVRVCVCVCDINADYYMTEAVYQRDVKR